LQTSYPNTPFTILFAAIQGKPVRGMLQKLEQVAGLLVVTTFDDPRAYNAEQLRLETQNAQQTEDWKSWLKHYLKHEKQPLLIVGSLYFISEVRKEIGKRDTE
ncbi:MAG: bifunctional folylpolyglutamate synthase/dihydrofolate synthase, partial [Bacilli bacterium]